MEFNLAEVHEHVAAAYPDRPSIVWPGGRRTAHELRIRSRQFANLLRDHGLGARPRPRTVPWESTQDHVALFLYDCPQYLEAMLGAYKARAVPYNVNYRYTATELAELLRIGGARALVYQAELAPRVAQAVQELAEPVLLVQVADDSGLPLLPGALDFDQAVAGGSTELRDVGWSPDDGYLVFTGGTTGRPKGVLWRQADIFVTCMGGRAVGRPDSPEHDSMQSIVDAAARTPAPSLLLGAPLMHGGGQWLSFQMLLSGGTVVLPSVTSHRGAADILDAIERERASSIVIVGEAFARPMVDELRRQPRDLSCLRSILTGGAVLTPATQAELFALLPHVKIVNALGSSEGGTQAREVAVAGRVPEPGVFPLKPGTCVLDDSREEILPPGHDGDGWLANGGRVPLGYLNDPEATARTFPVMDGRRMSVPGDRARHLADGRIEFLGRHSVTINSGGEKIFAEEVEEAILTTDKVADVVVVGVPSARWGEEVVAVVQTAPGAALAADEIGHIASQHLARYKVPKHVVFVEKIERSPAGKADYRWARQRAGTTDGATAQDPAQPPTTRSEVHNA